MSRAHTRTLTPPLPLAVAVTGANRHDSMLIEPMLDALPAVQHRRGRPRRRPDRLYADKGYDNRQVRTYAGAASPLASPAAALSRPTGSAGTAGSSNAPSAGCCTTAASPCATTALPPP